MRSNNKHKIEELVKYIHLYLEDGISHKELCKYYDASTIIRFRYSNPAGC